VDNNSKLLFAVLFSGIVYGVAIHKPWPVLVAVCLMLCIGFFDVVHWLAKMYNCQYIIQKILKKRPKGLNKKILWIKVKRKYSLAEMFVFNDALERLLMQEKVFAFEAVKQGGPVFRSREHSSEIYVS
jgi:hypothetical protein